MSFYPKQEERLDQLAEKLRLADEATPVLVADVIADACVRIPILNKTGKAAVRLARLIESHAWSMRRLRSSSLSCRSGSFAASSMRMVSGSAPSPDSRPFLSASMIRRMQITKSRR